jgi:hypothetical protein
MPITSGERETKEAFMKKGYLIIISIIFTAFVLAGCADGEGGFDGPFIPIINGISIENIVPNEALPGEEITITGQGLNSELAKIIVSNREYEPSSSFDFAFSSIDLDGDGDEDDNTELVDVDVETIRFIVPNDLEPGVHELHVEQGTFTSNVMTVTVLETNVNPVTPPPVVKNSADITMSTLYIMEALNYHYWGNKMNCDDKDGDGICKGPDKTKAKIFYVYEITWQLPEGIDEATIIAPLLGRAIYNEPTDAHHLHDFTKPELVQGMFSAQDVSNIDGMLAAYDLFNPDFVTNAANYMDVLEDSFNKCYNVEKPSHGYFSRLCKPMRVSGNVGSFKTITHELENTSIKHVVLEYDGGTATAEVPL